MEYFPKNNFVNFYMKYFRSKFNSLIPKLYILLERYFCAKYHTIDVFLIFIFSYITILCINYSINKKLKTEVPNKY